MTVDQVMAELVDSHSSALKRHVSSVDPRTPRLRPRKKKKKVVRFSDPGPLREASSGLTPFVSRTRISSGAISSPSASKQKSTVQDKSRRHSAPITRVSDDVQVEASPSLGPYQKFQYLPMSDCLTPRTVRSIRRFGLSEEMNRIHEYKRAEKRKEEERERELARLRDELSRLKNDRSDFSEHIDWQEKESLPVRRNLLGSFTAANDEPDVEISLSQGVEPDTDSIMTDTGHVGPGTLDTPITTYPTTPTDAGTQVCIPDLSQEAALERLNEEIDWRRDEERQLHKAWRAVINHGHPTGDTMDEEFPPPDLTEQVITTMNDATSRASKAAQALQGLNEELSSHGFNGSESMEIINNINSRFRQARLELERLVPGETSQADFSNWNDIIGALVRRIEILVRDLHDTREALVGCEGREKAIRNQFNLTLARQDDATRKIASLEQYNESVAEDMLHARMKIRDMEKEIRNQDSDKVRLHEALAKYQEDVKMLEQLNSQLEDEMASFEPKTSSLQQRNEILARENESAGQEIDALRKGLVDELKKHKETQSFLEQRSLEISTLHNEIQRLESEKDAIAFALKRSAEEKSRQHTQEVEILNARLSTVTSSLNEARQETMKLATEKTRLERHLDDFQRLFSREAIQMAHARAIETAQAFADWQQGLALIDHGGDTEPDDDDEEEPNRDIQVENRESFSAIGGEPITPAAESRFKNVVFTRGKKRRRIGADSFVDDVGEGDGRQKSPDLLSPQ